MADPTVPIQVRLLNVLPQGSTIEDGRCWYRLADPVGHVLAESSSPGEIASFAAETKDTVAGTTWRTRTMIVRTPWEPWTPEPETGDDHD